VLDTLVLSRLARATRDGGHSLASWADRFGRGFEKVENEDWSTWTPHMQRRCREDVRITMKLYSRFLPLHEQLGEASVVEHRVAHAAAMMVKRGFTLDTSRAHAVLDAKMIENHERLAEMQEMMPDWWVAQGPVKSFRRAPNKKHWGHGIIAGGDEFTPVELESFTPTARLQIAARLQTMGWKPKKFTATGLVDTSADVIRTINLPAAQLIADYLDTDKQIGQINSQPKKDGSGGGWLHHQRADERVHPHFNPTGANTHRSSCSAPNLQQVSSAEEMRRCWVPKKGWTLVGVDAKGLELRCLAHYLAKWDDGEYAQLLLEGDVHTHVQNLMGMRSRNKTKKFEYAWLYGAGDPKLGSILREDSGESGGGSNTKLGKAARSKFEGSIKGLSRLTATVKSKASSGKLRGIDGRTLWVRSPHSALNLLLQSCGAIIIKTAWAFMEEEMLKDDLVHGVHYATVIQVHDEWQIEARPEIAQKVGEAVRRAIKRAEVALDIRCPLDGSIHVGPSWADTH